MMLHDLAHFGLQVPGNTASFSDHPLFSGFCVAEELVQAEV
jgi:hypothetical protein